ncbi:MAG TPA: pyridoxal phosphate-dependent aminotransferase family protein [Candidatus Binatia bacterium]|jgi:7-keto-8-aminopelargonate synthetase-like enzyme|nr:pyridoxal phosphate-dependent aminotransferase family protein [Candidatus Binatia bacterium]
MTEPEPLQQFGRTYVRFRGRKLSYFSGCDYFRLASHPKVLTALWAGAKQYGLNVAASRLTTGNHVLYRKLERQLAGFFRAEDALLVPTGYLTNLVVAQTLAGNFSHALLDEESHPSLSDAARLLDCPLLRFGHGDAAELAGCIRRCGPGSKVILLTDGMFSRDGTAAPLKAYLEVLPLDAVMLVDDAHGAGVLGRTGRGSVEHAGVSRRRVIQTVTLSKAFGAYGGAILATAALRRQIINRSQLFVGSTPLPLPLANAALQAVKLVQTDKSLRHRLAHNAGYLKQGLRTAGLPVPDAPGPIVAVVPKRPGAAARISRRLLEVGIYPPFIHYPGGPAGGYFRFVVSSEHSRRQLDGLIGALVAELRQMS